MKNLTVIGGGVLGSQIAYQAAFCGFDVTIWMHSESSITRTKPKIEKLEQIYEATLNALKPNSYIPRGFQIKEFSPAIIDEKKAQAKDALAHLHYELDLATSLKEADLIIECVPENPQAKFDFYKEAKDFIPKDAIVATNTSTLLPSMFAQESGCPERFLAMHFANEIWINNTCEIMGSAWTSQETYDEAARYAEEMGMVPLVLKKEQSGYLLNSLLIPFLTAAQSLLVHGVADPQTIDLTWKLGTGAPKGPFEILDIVGAKTAYEIVSASPDAKDPNSTMGMIAALLKKMIDNNETFYPATKK